MRALQLKASIAHRMPYLANKDLGKKQRGSINLAQARASFSRQRAAESNH
jgi:hypothetical protein